MRSQRLSRQGSIETSKLEDKPDGMSPPRRRWRIITHGDFAPTDRDQCSDGHPVPRSHEQAAREPSHRRSCLVKKAYEFSQKHHEGQTRASGEPYLVHPLEVGTVLAEMQMDTVPLPLACCTTLSKTLRSLSTKSAGIWRAGGAHRRRRHQDQQNRFLDREERRPRTSAK